MLTCFAIIGTMYVFEGGILPSNFDQVGDLVEHDLGYDNKADTFVGLLQSKHWLPVDMQA